jgi:predicted nucleic-acid-binding Zn-ribbon protein
MIMGDIDKAKAWNELKCPVCGGNNFSSGERYQLVDAGGILDSMKGRIGKSFKVQALECRDCGYVALKRSL